MLAIMWLVESKPIRSNVTIPTTSFPRVFFFFFHKWCHVLSIMTSSIIPDPSPSILNIWRRGGLTALRLPSSAAVKLACIADVIQPRLVTSVKQCRNPLLRAPKSRYMGGGAERLGFQRCFADRLNQSLVSSVAQATDEHKYWSSVYC